MCVKFGAGLCRRRVRCPQQDPRVERRCLKSRQKKLERYMSHIRVFLANYLAHKTRKIMSAVAIMLWCLLAWPQGFSKMPLERAVEEQSAALFECSSSGFVASHVVTHRSCVWFTKQNLTWEGNCEQVAILMLIHGEQKGLRTKSE